jgi:starch synthase
MKKILFVTSEAHPLIKTGGLADVAGSLPKALTELGQDVRLIIPYYQAVSLDQEPTYRSTVRVNNRDINLFETRLPDTDVVTWLVEDQELYGTPGNPYLDENGEPWENIAERFAVFSRVAAEVAMDRANLDWKPDIVHCNDWQTGLVPALLSLEQDSPKTVFTIHNLAYQGLFPSSTFHELNLPGQLWNPAGLEFHEMFSFIKGGLVFSDRITTVSPTYAQEIQTPEFGYGLEGLLSHNHEKLSGIINGIDMDDWNPETDPAISQNYNASNLDNKQVNKIELQKYSDLPVDPEIPLFGLVSRLVEQKGIDLIAEILPEIVTIPIQLVLLGSGDSSLEHQLNGLSRLYPDKISVTIGYNEKLAHQIEAGIDVFLMPSRFEPCGLNQMYSQRYGTIPLVRQTGGLADTVVDAMPDTLIDKSATGIAFDEPSAGALHESIKRALLLFNDKKTWRTMQKTAMDKDFSWQNSAKQYLKLYQSIS